MQKGQEFCDTSALRILISLSYGRTIENKSWKRGEKLKTELTKLSREVKTTLRREEMHPSLLV